MANILKKLREEAHLTQADAAEKLEKSINTIQNWERNGKISKDDLFSLLDLYGVDEQTRNKAVLELFGDRRTPEEKSKADNFPEFLFRVRPEITEAARAAVLSAEEMDLFGYVCYMKGMNHSIKASLMKLPLEYTAFQKYGGYFQTMSRIQSIEERIGSYAVGKNTDSLAQAVYEYGMTHPGAAFNFSEMDRSWVIEHIRLLKPCAELRIDIRGLYEQCKAAEEQVLLGRGSQAARKVNLPETIRGIVSAEAGEDELAYNVLMDKVCGQCFEIRREKTILTDDDERWLCLTEIGRQYIKWAEE